MSVVIITGCSSGIGLEAALCFARNGDTVYATMRDLSKATALENAANREGLPLNLKALDVTRPDTFTAFIDEIIAISGRVDVLVHNAGIAPIGALEDVSVAKVQAVFETNLLGPLLLSRAALPSMRIQNQGYLIAISSLSGIVGRAGDVLYSSSKFALEGAFEALRHEVERWGIKVALVEPGLVATQLFESAGFVHSKLPADYPVNSPYRPLIKSQIDELQQGLKSAMLPREVGELLVQIAQSDGKRLRWPVGEKARHIINTFTGPEDNERDALIRDASQIHWWTEGT